MPPQRELDSETRRIEFEAVALPLMGAVYRTALRLTRGSEDAADIVQETYLRAYRTFHSFVPGTNCRGWLFTILYSVFINHYHKKRRDNATLSLDNLERRYQGYLESAEDPGAHAATVEIRGVRLNPEVDDALRQLPEEFRAAVLFVDLEGLSYDEAASVLRCPVGTVRSRLYRGRKLLFAALQGYATKLGFRGSES
jgi:RNA polymerase sigma-70 factor (ECF subfamily)